MSHDLADVVPAPDEDPEKIEQDTLEIGRAEHGGWFCTINNARLLKCTATMREMADWLDETFALLDRRVDDLVKEDEATPANRPAETARKSLFTSWRRDH